MPVALRLRASDAIKRYKSIHRFSLLESERKSTFSDNEINEIMSGFYRKRKVLRAKDVDIPLNSEMRFKCILKELRCSKKRSWIELRDHSFYIGNITRFIVADYFMCDKGK